MINKTKRAVIMGATSGIGYEVARFLLSEGWKLGLAGRREENLRKLQSEFPGQVCIKAIDVKDEDAGNALFSLIDELGGMDMYFHSSGIGYQNANLDADIELNTLETNGTGFTRMVGAAFRYFIEQLASMKKIDIRFTDIRPGFVATNLLNDGKKYPMLMKTDYTARLIVKALNRKKRIAVIDWKYRILVFFWRLIPRCVWKRMSVKN